MSTAFLRTPIFWLSALLTGAVVALVYAWELDFLTPVGVPGPLRPEATTSELILSAVIIALIAVNAGLYNWRRQNGSCPIGTKRATGVGGFLGAAALICPVCAFAPIPFFGVTLSLAFLLPFLPLLEQPPCLCSCLRW